MAGHRRTSFEIMTAVLEGIREQGDASVELDRGVAVNKRQLMRTANINHSQLTDYLDTMERKELVILTEAESKLQIKITATGEQFLQRAKTLSMILDEDSSGDGSGLLDSSSSPDDNEKV